MTTAKAEPLLPNVHVPDEFREKIARWASMDDRDPQKVLEFILRRFFSEETYEEAVEEGLRQAEMGLTIPGDAVLKHLKKKLERRR